MEEGENEISEQLSRRERRRLLKEQAREGAQAASKSKIGKWIIGILVLVALSWGGYSLFKGSTTPLPGESVTDAGRDHITDIYGVTYTSNPPTSGPHFPVWAKPGVYDRFISDGYLIHSMEHGYVIIWYDCNKPISNGSTGSPSRAKSKDFQFPVSNVYAHDEPAEESTDSGQLLMHMKVELSEGMSWITVENAPEVELELPDSFKSDSCKDLVSKLSAFTKVAQRVIVVPKQNLDTLIAVTSWGRIDKMENLDQERITAFIKAFHNRGPEQTQE
ncbi:hypothetical protein A2985_01030 [Candidatus Woesebacteria bacterium RIFCSPLOWO2_01_FULL_43_11]|uniref:DUF3105 domain-containing protein n=1 Tax=Candidatus Woesebacteria bacterium RBG_16_42_24 TaxID=1802485 RepID=A0A1F7XLP7_9BACT|nr:MAG: hypothetical protein A2V97_02920 [Candidatus Woesebacteria bacterium RBG_16_42_24]OGM68383.1 MAG: hypothetical protein A2985_01030 [Candidatus Woesebacteria bacterium RIFCSPLOWO2_01_FULL_43_11]